MEAFTKFSDLKVVLGSSKIPIPHFFIVLISMQIVNSFELAV